MTAGNSTRCACLCLSATVLLAAVAAAQDVRLRPQSALYADAEGIALSGPEGVGAGGGSMVVVADTGNRRLVRFDVVAGRLAPTAVIRAGQLRYPTQVRVDSRGNVLALDGRSHRIVRLASTGDFVGFVDASGAVGGGEVVVRSFELDSEDNLYVLDVAGERVVVLGPDDSLRRQIRFGADVGFLSDLAVGDSGAVFAIDSVAKRVLRAAPGEVELRPLAEDLEEDVAFPVAIAADGRGRLLVADQRGGGIVILGQDGSFAGRQSAMGWREGFLRYPSALSVAGDTLFVADRGNNRVQAFSIVR